MLLLSVDWVPPDLRPSGAGLALGTRIPAGLFTQLKVTPQPGCVSSNVRRKPAALSVHSPSVLRTNGVPGSYLAMAHLKPTSSRGMATTP